MCIVVGHRTVGISLGILARRN